MVEVSASRENNIPNNQILSPYYRVAVDKVNSRMPEFKEDVETILRSVDKQGVDNFSTFSYEGATFPTTKVSVNPIVDDLLGESRLSDISPRITYILTPGFAFPPYGHPFTPWDMVYDRVFQEMRPIVSAQRTNRVEPRTDVYVIGSPNSLWGVVSQEWLDGMKKEGFARYGKALNYFINKFIIADREKDTNPRIIINGMSLGGIVAKETFVQLPQVLREKTQLLIDNPAGEHSRLAALIKAVQIPLGFIGEAVLRSVFDPHAKDFSKREAEFMEDLSNVLKLRKILSHNNQQEIALKRKAVAIDIKNLLKGSRFNEQMRTYVRRGIYDPTSFNPINFLRTIGDAEGTTGVIDKGNSSEFAIKTSHFINRYRISSWRRTIEMIRNVKNKA